MSTFKVWIEIEGIDEDGDPTGEGYGPVDVGEFATLEEAEDFRVRLEKHASEIERYAGDDATMTPQEA